MKETLKERIARYKAQGYTSAAYEAEQHLKTLEKLGKILKNKKK